MTEQMYAGLEAHAANLGTVGGTPWPSMIEQIQSDEDSGMEELYRVFSRGVRFFFWRHLGHQDLDDAVHDTFVMVAQAIRRGDIRDPERLMGFVWTVVRRQLAAQIDRSAATRAHQVSLDGFLPADRGGDPEWTAMVSERQVMARRLLGEVSARDREILVRFYLREQTQAEICREMELTETQFRLLKSRAKARLAKVGQRETRRRKIAS